MKTPNNKIDEIPGFLVKSAQWVALASVVILLQDSLENAVSLSRRTDIPCS